jgi:hypothetical protein
LRAGVSIEEIRDRSPYLALYALSIWSLALGQSLLVASPQDCPAAAVVDARVREILGLSADDALAESATIAREGSSLRVTVRGTDERVLGERLLQADGNCAELAGTVAVVVATWISDVHPEYVGSLPVEPSPVLPEPTPPHPKDAGIDARQVPPAASPPRQLLFGVALGAQLSAASATPFGALGVRFVPRRSGFGLAAAAAVTGARRVALSSGSLRYFRWPLTLGPVFRAPLAGAELDLHAGAALSWLRLEGVDFSPSATRNALAAGGFAAARVSFGSGAFVPFGELSGVLWQRSEAFVQRGPEQPAIALPLVELYAAFGGAWRAW